MLCAAPKNCVSINSFCILVMLICLFVWFDSLCPINNLSVIKGRVFLGWTSIKLGLMFLLKDTTQWRRWGLKPAALRSRVKHSTTEPLRSLICWFVFKANFFAKKKSKKNQEYLAPSECQKCWVKIRAGRIKIRTDRSWSGSKLFAKTKMYKY